MRLCTVWLARRPLPLIVDAVRCWSRHARRVGIGPVASPREHHRRQRQIDGDQGIQEQEHRVGHVGGRDWTTPVDHPERCETADTDRNERPSNIL